MSEQNILNPTASSPLNPDFGFSDGLPDMLGRFDARSGKAFTRQLLVRGRVYDLPWAGRSLATRHLLEQWANQYRQDCFSYQDLERGRYFSGRFAGPLVFSPAGNENWNIRGRFQELPGLALFAYPTNWSRDAVFREERNGFGEDLVKLTGSWTFVSTGIAHGGAYTRSNTTNDTAEWVYFGYGFRFWSPTRSNFGIVAVSVDGGAETNVDLYSAGDVNSAALLTTASLPLGQHRVKLRVTGTKNASSTDFHVAADAIEVMR
ncbi:MAG: hypothetical protein ACRD2R_00120 [Terriglobales bacterium]